MPAIEVIVGGSEKWFEGPSNEYVAMGPKRIGQEFCTALKNYLYEIFADQIERSESGRGDIFVRQTNDYHQYHPTDKEEVVFVKLLLKESKAGISPIHFNDLLQAIQTMFEQSVANASVRDPSNESLLTVDAYFGLEVVEQQGSWTGREHTFAFKSNKFVSS